MSQDLPDTEALDISGIGKGALLSALYEAALESDPIYSMMGCAPFSTECAFEFIDQSREDNDGCIAFDYLEGIPLKIDITGDTMDPTAYDNNNGGPGAAARVVAHLRAQR